MGGEHGSGHNRTSPRGSPRHLSQQLGIPVQDVLSAIEFGRLEPSESENGSIEYELKPVLSAYLEQSRTRDSQQNQQIQNLLRECLEAYQDSVRQMIREENRVAYQIKDMTESRFLEVLGQVSLSLGRVEAFVMQAARLLSQIDMRIAHAEKPRWLQTASESAGTAPVPKAQPQPSLNQINSGVVERRLTNSEHWREFEAQLTRIFAASGLMAESAISEWMSSARSVLNLGSLELRLKGEPALDKLRPALSGSSFAALNASLPSDEEILPAFENYQMWIRSELSAGHSAVLLYLILILNRGPQMSWSGFVTTFVNEA